MEPAGRQPAGQADADRRRLGFDAGQRRPHRLHTDDEASAANATAIGC
jgi:hypothetical protein